MIDGGFATQLEKHGAVIDDPLWSAVCLISDHDLIKKVMSLPFLFFFFLFRCITFSSVLIDWVKCAGPFGVLGGRDKYFGFFVLPGL